MTDTNIDKSVARDDDGRVLFSKVSLREIEMHMLIKALDAVCWDDTPDHKWAVETDASKAERIKRKLTRAFEHTDTEFE